MGGKRMERTWSGVRTMDQCGRCVYESVPVRLPRLGCMCACVRARVRVRKSTWRRVPTERMGGTSESLPVLHVCDAGHLEKGADDVEGVRAQLGVGGERQGGVQAAATLIHGRHIR